MGVDNDFPRWLLTIGDCWWCHGSDESVDADGCPECGRPLSVLGFGAWLQLEYGQGVVEQFQGLQIPADEAAAIGLRWVDECVQLDLDKVRANFGDNPFDMLMGSVVAIGLSPT